MSANLLTLNSTAKKKCCSRAKRSSHRVSHETNWQPKEVATTDLNIIASTK